MLRLGQQLRGRRLSAARRWLSGSVPRLATTPVTMPAMSPTMTTGNIVRWAKKEGDKVAPGDVLLEIETDKATIDVETQEAGVLAKIILPPGSKDVPVSALIGLMVDEGDDWKAAKVPAGSAVSSTPSAQANVAPTTPTAAPPSPSPAAPAGRPTTMPLSPAVTVLVEANHLDVSKIPATGPRGRLLKGDVLAYLSGDKQATPAPALAPALAPPSAPTQPAAAAAPAPAPQQAAPAAKPAAKTSGEQPSTYTEAPVTQMRRVIAKRLTESKMKIPHFYTTASVDMTNVLAWRKQQQVASEDKSARPPSVNTLVMKATAVALRLNMDLNVNFVNDAVVRMPQVDLSFAVAIENGLITPIVKRADELPLAKLSEQIEQLATRARTGKLKPEEYQGGSFSVSNLGMYGIREFTAVMNPPQAGILAVSSTTPHVVLPPNGAADAKPIVQQRMNVTLSGDARVVDPVLAESFLTSFRTLMETPQLL